MAAPAPNAPDAATVTCHASPASTSRPLQSRRQVIGFARMPASTAPSAYASGPSLPLRPLARSAAGPRRPALATFTNGRSSFIQPSSIDRRWVPWTASRHAADIPSGSPSRRAKSFAVPTGTIASGTPARPAAAAAAAIVPSPPAATSRSAPSSTASSSWATSNALTSAPRARRRSAHRSALFDPDRSFATRAIVVRARVRSPGAFPDASVPAMLLDPMSARARAFVTRPLPGHAVARLAAAHDVEVWPDRMPPPRSELLARAPELDGLLSMLTDTVDAELMDAAPNLRAISNYAVGVDNVDVDAAAARGIPVGNTPDVLTDSTADLAIALMLAVGRRLAEGEAFVRAGEWSTWEPGLMLGRDLHGATVGVVGYGRIGSAVGRRPEGFGCELLTTSRSGGVPLDELLERSDFVTLHCPLTPETRGLIGAEALRR